MNFASYESCGFKLKFAIKKFPRLKRKENIIPSLQRSSVAKKKEYIVFRGSKRRWFRKKLKSGFLHLMISMSYENEIVRFGTFYEFIKEVK